MTGSAIPGGAEAVPSRRPKGASELPDPGFSVAHLDPSVSPSVDFYRYAAGSWLRKNPVPADKSRWGAFDELLQRNFHLLHELLDEAARSASDAEPTPRRQVGTLFASAMDTAQLERLGVEPIRGDLARIEAVRSTTDLVELVAAFHREGTDGPFDTYVYPDRRASDVYAFYLHQGGLSLPDREYYLDDAFAEVRAAYRAHLERSFRAVGDGAESAARAADTVLRIETRLATVSRSRTELRDEEKNYHKVPVPELAARHPGIPWTSYLALREVARVPHVIVAQPEFFVALEGLLAEEPLAAWKTYLRWRVIVEAAPFLHAEMEAADFDFFHRTLLGQQEPEPRWKRSALIVDACLGEALGQLYVERAFSAEARARMALLIGDLKAVFEDRLRSREWMSEATRERALAKFARFTAKIGHPERFRDYGSIRLSPVEYLGNVRRARAFEVHRQVARVGQPVDRTEWGMTPPTVNAYFSPVFNEIVFPAGILQPPFFDVRQDDAVNYGGIGAVIGHEITHGYDDQGRKYDASGNLADWWTAQDAEEFDRRAQAVVRQYNGFEPLPGVHVNGELTLGENLADLGGLAVAFEALQRRLAADPARRQNVDGLSPEQRFFVAWAQIWRQNLREPELRRRIVTDPHAPGPCRAMGAAVHLAAFFDAFRIPEGSPMWRAGSERVAIW